MKLREIGIQPDVLLVRTQKKISEDVRSKLSLFCSVSEDHVIEVKDVEYSIYQVPLILHNQNLDQILVERLKLKTQELDIQRWDDMLYKLRNPKSSVTIGVVGKYIELKDAYKSIYEALGHGGIANNVSVHIKRISSDTHFEHEAPMITQELENIDGVLIPGGFGQRGIEGKICAVKYARDKGIPTFGICLGLQCMVIEFARNVIGFKDANSSEFDENTSAPVIHLMPEQEAIEMLGGTMRLGAYDCEFEENTFASNAYNKAVVSERHRHRYELNKVFEEDFLKHGMKLSGRNPQTNLVEIVELPSHPWFVGVQFHPEFQSRPTNAHPLFESFIKASIEFRKSKQ
jgi:CTP synthase